MATKNLVPRNDNEGKLGTGAKRWNTVNALNLYGKLQIQDYNSTTDTEPTDLFLVYDQSNSEPRVINKEDLNLGGINSLDIRADSFSLDDTNTGSDFGTAFNIYKTVDFTNVSYGSAWYSFSFPKSWKPSEDINIEMKYILEGGSTDNIVKVDTDVWLVSLGDQPDINNPDLSNSDNISTTSNNIGKYSQFLLNNGSIGAGDILNTTESIVIRLGRDVGGDTYTGTLKLMSLIISQ